MIKWQLGQAVRLFMPFMKSIIFDNQLLELRNNQAFEKLLKQQLLPIPWKVT